MRRFALCFGALVLGLAIVQVTSAQDAKWANLKGQVVWQGDVPVQPKIVPGVNKDVCATDKEPLEEDYIINSKNKGLKNVFVWLRPADAKKDDWSPSYSRPFCCYSLRRPERRCRARLARQNPLRNS